jgi:hypothetical protein
MQVAEQMGVGRLIAETDCLNLNHAFVSTDYRLAPIGTMSR